MPSVGDTGFPVMEWISHNNKRYSTENIVNGIVTAFVSWDGSYICEHSITHTCQITVLYTITWCVAYTSIKKKPKKINKTPYT